MPSWFGNPAALVKQDRETAEMNLLDAAVGKVEHKQAIRTGRTAQFPDAAVLHLHRLPVVHLFHIFRFHEAFLIFRIRHWQSPMPAAILSTPAGCAAVVQDWLRWLVREGGYSADLAKAAFSVLRLCYTITRRYIQLRDKSAVLA
jgi:hypothetical protein